MSPVTLSPRAVQRLEQRSLKVQSWYLDLSMVRQYWGSERFYHHTAPINMLYGLNEALTIALEEGLEQRFARHRAAHRHLRGALAEIGIGYVSQEGFGLPMLNAVKIPEGVEDLAVRKRLLEEFNIEIGGGLGAFKGKAWRIGLMGHGATMGNADAVVGALRGIMK
jgi:alanine-glyoxylate transaminase/serine-glyoxylate transaminase/serine-pyruvate transaminase